MVEKRGQETSNFRTLVTIGGRGDRIWSKLREKRGRVKQEYGRDLMNFDSSRTKIIIFSKKDRKNKKKLAKVGIDLGKSGLQR